RGPTAPRWPWWPSTPPAPTAAGRSWATASGCSGTAATPACTSAAWRHATTSAGSRRPPAMPRTCSTRSGSACLSSRRSASTVAGEGTGMAELWQAIGQHWDYLRASGEYEVRRGRGTEREVMDLVERALAARLRATLGAPGQVGEILERARNGALDPHSAAQAILDRLLTQSR